MSSTIVDIIREHVLQTLAQQGTIPFQITRRQYDAATASVAECLESTSRNRDASPRDIQRETTMLALQAIPRAIAGASKQLESIPTQDTHKGTSDAPPEEKEASIDNLVQQEMARRLEQDASLGVTPPPSDSHTPPPPQHHPAGYTPDPPVYNHGAPTSPTAASPTHIPTYNQHPASQQPPIAPHTMTPPPITTYPPVPPHPTTSTQPASHGLEHTMNQPTTIRTVRTVSVTYNPDEVYPVRIQYTPDNNTRYIQVDRILMPQSIRDTSSPFMICSLNGNDIYTFQSHNHPAILKPSPHTIQRHPDENYTITFRNPDGDYVNTELTGISITKDNKIHVPATQGVHGVRIKLRGKNEYSDRVYTDGAAYTPSGSSDEPPDQIESAICTFHSPWAITVFITEYH